jgi:NAD(P)-dependent dehydrogenase (short-subunit alcohol dehydrogenase family)
MTRPTFLVTGATDGIGRQTALNLARHGVRVLVHGRSRSRAETAVAELKTASGKADLDAVSGDFSSLTQVRSLAEQILSLADPLDGIVHNAGVYTKSRHLTEDGLETTFQVNHLAAFLLSHLLLDRLVAAPAARIIVVSSVAHQGGYVDWHNLQGEKVFDGYSAYALSKLANLLFAFELAARLQGTRITVNGLHPGVVSTKLLKAGFHMEGADVERGARTSTYLATSPEVAGVSGRYFVDCKPTVCSRFAEDPALRARFWEVSEALAKLAPSERIGAAPARV